MNSRLNLIVMFCLALLVVSSCKELLEPAINKRIVLLEAPGDQYQSKSYTVNFWWDEIPDALKYRLQIVTPKFDSVDALITDTLIKANKFLFNLNPGQYQWRVKAFNGGSETNYSAFRSFTVLASSIRQQSVQLGSPGNNTLTNQGTVTFQWGTLYGATKYHLQIDTSNFVDATKIVYDQSTPAQEYAFNFPKDQRYQWRVRAENDTAQAQWSGINTVIYDHTPPGQVTLSSPANNKMVSIPVNLQWNTVATASKYKLYVLKSDSLSPYNSSFPLFTNNNSYTFNSGTPGDRLYWKVSAVDAAGNEGQVSVLQNFVLQ